MRTLRHTLSPLVQGVELVGNRPVSASVHEAEGDLAVFRGSLSARGHRLPTKLGLLKNPRGHTLPNNALNLRLLVSGETTTKRTLCLTAKHHPHHPEGDIAG